MCCFVNVYLCYHICICDKERVKQKGRETQTQARSLEVNARDEVEDLGNYISANVQLEARYTKSSIYSGPLPCCSMIQFMALLREPLCPSRERCPTLPSLQPVGDPEVDSRKVRRED